MLIEFCVVNDNNTKYEKTNLSNADCHDNGNSRI